MGFCYIRGERLVSRGDGITPEFLRSNRSPRSEGGLLSIEDLLELFANYGRVTYQSILYPRFRSNNSPLAKDLKECIICLKKVKESLPGEGELRTFIGLVGYIPIKVAAHIIYRLLH